MIDTVRISHANSELLNELMRNGKVEIDEEQMIWSRLRSEGKGWQEIVKAIKLPHMALLRNLRGIFSEIEDLPLCKELLNDLKSGVEKGKQFPFRYFSAYKAIEQSEVSHKRLLLDALEECIDISRIHMPELKGKTISLSDNSGSAWGTFNSEYGQMTVAEINNLSSVITAQNAEEGYVGIFGDRLQTIDISKKEPALKQTNKGNFRSKKQNWLFNRKRHLVILK